MERKFTLSEGEYYHIYNRGVDKRPIFLNNTDRNRFQRLLYLMNTANPVIYRATENKSLQEIERKDTIVAIGAYCLMPNHFHLLMKETSQGGITRFMEKLTTAYSMYFNIKNKRSGALFQGKFKAQHVDEDEYLKYLYAYVHLNPTKLVDKGWVDKKITNSEKTRKYISTYRYSSYLDYSGIEREEGMILAKSEFPEYFLKKQEFKNFVHDWMSYDPTA